MQAKMLLGLAAPIAWRSHPSQVCRDSSRSSIGPDAASVQRSDHYSAPDMPSAEHVIEPRLSIAPGLEEQGQRSFDAVAR
jgi:hypothetical protein